MGPRRNQFLVKIRPKGYSFKKRGERGQRKDAKSSSKSLLAGTWRPNKGPQHSKGGDARCWLREKEVAHYTVATMIEKQGTLKGGRGEMGNSRLPEPRKARC